MIRIMFLCTGNTCRSQMAEGFAKFYGKDFFEVHSAGVKAEGFVNPIAIKVMQELGIDISDQKSKVIDPVLLNNVDYIITLCGNAEETCPITPPHIKRIHIPIEDPSKTIGREEEVLSAFRNARDEIKDKIKTLLEEIIKEKQTLK
ncbi:MAG: arsenate reductase (thioredoxin) [Acidobacteria bacterium]|nr:arsenate reductase (thioredoxin) [Acidobacteriota bacterium]